MSAIATPTEISDQPCLSLKNVGVKYGLQKANFRKKTKEFWALKDVSFDLYQGETLGILGSNGAGKSTLLKVLAGIITIDRGWFKMEENFHVQLLTLGLGFEAPLSGRMNAVLSGMLLGKSRQYMEKRLEQIIEFSELGDFIDQPIYTYSSGMMTRLGFAVALEAQCDVLLIDEALAVGDGHFQQKSAAAIQQLMASKKTLVLVSHSIAEIQKFCKRAVWIDQGATKAIGPVEEIYEQYEKYVHDKTSHVVRSHI